MNSTEIQFIIQCLDGDTFPISIARTDAEKIYRKRIDNKVFYGESNPYNQYGLDVLKDAISVHNGTDPVIQQLVTQDSELTISDSLIPLENKVITLMIKPSFLIDFSNFGNYCNDSVYIYGPSDYHLVANIKFLADAGGSEPVIGYLQRGFKLPPAGLCDKHVQWPQIEVIGQYRDFFKIATITLPVHLLRDSQFVSSETYKHVWLRYDNRSMKIVLH